MKRLRTAILLLLSSLSISCFAQDEPEKATAIINFLPILPTPKI
jgi:hypothetical protein